MFTPLGWWWERMRMPRHGMPAHPIYIEPAVDRERLGVVDREREKHFPQGELSGLGFGCRPVKAVITDPRREKTLRDGRERIEELTEPHQGANRLRRVGILGSEFVKKDGRRDRVRQRWRVIELIVHDHMDRDLIIGLCDSHNHASPDCEVERDLQGVFWKIASRWWAHGPSETF